MFCPIAAGAEFGVEMFGGYSFAELKDFNASLTNVFNVGFLDGYAAPKQAKAIPGFIEADVKIRFSMSRVIPVYLRLGLTRLVDTQVLRDTATGTDIATSTVSFNTLYAGLGAKYLYRFNRSISVFAGGDAGLYVPFASSWELKGNEAAIPFVDNNPTDPAYNAYQKMDLTGAYFGGNAGLGAEWQASGSWGLIAEIGCRIAKYAPAYKKEGAFGRPGFDLKEVDMSGPYATAGLVFYIDSNSGAAAHGGQSYSKRF